MTKRKFFDIYEGRNYELMAKNVFGLAPELMQRYGIKVASRKRFSRSNLVIRGSEKFVSNFLEQSTGYADFFLYDVVLTTSGIFLHYRTTVKREYGKIMCKPVVGLRLELEIPKKDSDCAEKYIMEYDEDQVFGKLLRIWEYIDGVENKLTMLEDGHIIVLKNL